MKRYLIMLSMLCGVTVSSYSQDVSIELSVHYETMFNDFLDTITNVPFLDVTYVNNTEQNIFLKGVCDEHWPYPKFVKGTMMGYPYEIYMSPDYYEILAFRHSNYAEDFIVELDGLWTAFDSSQVIDEEISPNYINDDLCDMYNWKSLDEIKKTGVPRPEEVWLEAKNLKGWNLVFLKAKSKYVRSYNLMAFCINNGSFLFRVSPHYLTNAIFENCWNAADNCFLDSRLLLPDEIGRYLRYDGEINTKDFLLEIR